MHQFLKTLTSWFVPTPTQEAVSSKRQPNLEQELSPTKNSCPNLPLNYRIVQNSLGEYGYQQLLKYDHIEYWWTSPVWRPTIEDIVDFINFHIKEKEKEEQRKKIIKIFEVGE